MGLLKAVDIGRPLAWRWLLSDEATGAPIVRLAELLNALQSDQARVEESLAQIFRTVSEQERDPGTLLTNLDELVRIFVRDVLTRLQQQA
jgi:hypothetical protein